MIGKSQYQRASDDLSGPLEVADPSRILLVAGPRGAGRSSLVAALAQSGVPPADPSALGGSGSGATSGASVTVNVPPTVTTGRGTAGVGSSVVQLERDDFDSQVWRRWWCYCQTVRISVRVGVGVGVVVEFIGEVAVLVLLHSSSYLPGCLCISLLLFFLPLSYDCDFQCEGAERCLRVMVRSSEQPREWQHNRHCERT